MIQKLIFTILFFSMLAIGARRTTCKNEEPCQGETIWWRSLIELPYAVNLYPGSQPLGFTEETFRETIREAFNVWSETGKVSFREISMDSFNPDANCKGYKTETSCLSNDCFFINGTCTQPIGTDHFEELNVITNSRASYLLSKDRPIAQTNVIYNGNSGEIYEASIIINNYDNDFDLGSSPFKYNLKGILVHEIGHLIGISHPCSLSEKEPWTSCHDTNGDYLETTMYPKQSAIRDEDISTLEADDIEALNMVCDDNKTLCLNEDGIYPLSTDQSAACFRVETTNHSQSSTPFILLMLPFLMLLFFKKLIKKIT